MWARCATLIEEYENKTGTHYDLIFRSRPDLEWTMKQSHVEAVAKKFDMLNDKRVVLSAEDQIHFFHRDQIGFLKDMSKTKDPEVCEELFKVCYKIIMDDFDKPKGKKDLPGHAEELDLRSREEQLLPSDGVRRKSRAQARGVQGQ